MFENLRLLAHAGVLAGLLVMSTTVHAQSAPVHKVGLSWVRSAGADACIDSDELAQRVEQRLGRQVFARASDVLLVIDGEVSPAHDPGFAAVIRVRGPDGTLYGSREVSVPDSDCHKLDDVLALIISVTLRHAGGISLPESIADQLDGLLEDRPPEAQPAAESGAATAPARSEETPPSVRAWRIQTEAGLGFATGLAASASFAPLLRVQLQLERLYTLALEGRLALTQAQRVASEPRGTLEYRSAALALLGCVSPLRAAALHLAVCVDGRVGSLGVRARDFARSAAARQAWFELALSGSVRAALLGPTYAHLRVGVPWRLVRPQFQYEDSQGNVHDALRAARWGLDLSLSLGVEF